MPFPHITVANSTIAPAGNALNANGPGTLIVDANAFLISESGGSGAVLAGARAAIINGVVGSFGGGFYGLLINANSPADVTSITVGRTGDVFGSTRGINFKEGAGSIKNLGTISSLFEAVVWDATTPGNLIIINSGLIVGIHSGVTLDSGAATIVNTGTIRGDDFSIISGSATHLTNSGKLQGGVLFGDGADTFTDFKKVGHVIKNGTVSGVIDLGSGGDHFNGGAISETVRDGNGSDVYKLGGGNDTYISGVNGGPNDVDTVDGGRGIDTYDASAATASVTVTLSPPFASGADIGFDNIAGFENAIGGSGNDFLFGNNAANTLIGGAGGDELKGLGGHDTLTGGTGVDTFAFTKLSDSGTKASARDLITDFTPGQDHIDLSAIDAKTGGLDDEFSFIGGSNFGHHKGELRESFSNGDFIVSGDVNGDGKADFSIALKGHILLHDTDFVL